MTRIKDPAIVAAVAAVAAGPFSRTRCGISRYRELVDGSEVDALNRSQIATGSQKHRDPRFLPLVFTEHGAIMAATILNSERAVEMSVMQRSAPSWTQSASS
jgi:hypothetical protein